MLLMGACIWASSSIARGDDVAEYLELHGLKQLLAVHLEKQLEHEKPNSDSRAQLVERLADLYAELLETVKDPDEQAYFEERGQALLEQVPANKADKLKLTLLRAKYLGAEVIAENHRLRLSTPEEVESAIRVFQGLAPEFSQLRAQIKQNMEVADRRLTRSGGAETVALNEIAERTRGLYAQTTFLNAWTSYYLGWLNNRPNQAAEAETLFLEIMDPEAKSARPEEISVDLRSIDAVARSMLGMALCKSLTASSATAISWVELLEDENTFEPLREQAIPWKIAIHLEHREYEEARAIIDDYIASGKKFNNGWLRLIAVHTLEDEQRSRAGSDLAKMSITELAVRGELDQVLDLAHRYGAESLGESGFALHYVKGVIKYQEVRAAHGNETPTIDAALTAGYAEAGNAFAAAINSADAKSFPAAVIECKKLVAWCMYLQSKFLEARDAFLAASDVLTGADAAEAFWMGIVAFDRVVEAAPSNELQLKMNELIVEFLDQFPESPHAPTLQLRRAITSGSASETTVTDLLSIPPESEVYGSAQRHVAELLYQQFRRRENEARVKYGSDFLMVAMPLINARTRDADLADPTETRRYIGRCRQILEVALTEGIERLGAARSAFEALEYIQQNHNVDLTEFEDEIHCRRAQERLYADDWQRAGELADELWQRDQSMIWTRMAARSMFKYGHGVWKNPDSKHEQVNVGLQLVVRYGGRVLHEFKDDPKALEQPGALGYHTAVAEASLLIWQQAGDQDRGKAALFLYDKLLMHRPRNSNYLRAVGLLAREFGPADRALDCWRKLVSGSDVTSPQWFEAKYYVIEILSRTDPRRAREVMDQHKLLNPEIGPEPWATRLKELDEKIPKTSPQQSETQPSDNLESGELPVEPSNQEESRQ